MRNFVRMAMLSAAAVTVLVGASAVFAQEPTLDKLSFIKENTYYYVKAASNVISGAIVIPDTYKDFPVIGVAQYGFNDCSNMTGVTIPAKVRTVGSGAFNGCTNLKSITFGGNNTSADWVNSFPAGGNDLKVKYGEGGAGTYTRQQGGNTWTKQGGYAPPPPPPPTSQGGKLVGTANGRNDTYDDDQRKIPREGELIDRRDDQTYRTVRIGNQTWMAENLNYQTSGSRCYGNDNSNCKKYGRLYTWNDAQRVCPPRFHLPSRKEWGELVDVAKEGSAGTELKSKNDWGTGRGTDRFGFSALPGGYFYTNGSFDKLGQYGDWWTTTESGSDKAYYRNMGYDRPFVVDDAHPKGFGFSVRCVKD